MTIPLKGNDADLNADLAAMREAANDELFLADLEETMVDFHHVDVTGALMSVGRKRLR